MCFAIKQEADNVQSIQRYTRYYCFLACHIDSQLELVPHQVCYAPSMSTTSSANKSVMLVCFGCPLANEHLFSKLHCPRIYASILLVVHSPHTMAALGGWLSPALLYSALCLGLYACQDPPSLHIPSSFS